MHWLLRLSAAAIALACTEKATTDRPNVVLILVDDMGAECIASYGGLSYNTPHIDRLAEGGLRFEHCYSLPLCTPSRVQIMTGMYNFRNYEYFGYLGDREYTFGNLFADAGYKTCIAGKWQLNGISFPDRIANWNDNSRPHHFGFGEYCLWQLTQGRNKGERFAGPLIEKNGELIQYDPDAYGPDIFADFLIDFVRRHKSEPFFAYYPMVLVHEPFVPTPRSLDWADRDARYRNDTAYFKDMMQYMDIIVGRIIDALEETGTLDNTLLIFTADNGTDRNIVSQTNAGAVRGAKGNTIRHGIHVPLIISWPRRIAEPRSVDCLVGFADFFPTFCEMLGVERESDGYSFYPLLNGGVPTPRQSLISYYDPRWGEWVNQFRNVYVHTADYKLYRDGRFYHTLIDPMERHPLSPEELGPEQRLLKSQLETRLSDIPPLPD